MCVLLRKGGRVGGRDEIASLGRSFNSMLVQLEDLREQVEVQGFELGRSESAVVIMHNVRNALTPISTILSAGMDRAPLVDRAMLDRVIAQNATIARHACRSRSAFRRSRTRCSPTGCC